MLSADAGTGSDPVPARTPRTTVVRGVLVGRRRYGEAMKYVVMIFRSLDRTWTDEDQQAVGRLMRLEQELAESGELVRDRKSVV